MSKLEDAEVELQALVDGSLETFEAPEIIEERIQEAIEQSEQPNE